MTTTLNINDLRIDGSSYEISLVKLVGSPIVDITGYITDPYGGGPSFHISTVHFANGTHCWVGGEHDHPYLENSYSGNPELSVPNLDADTLEDLYRQRHKDEE